jgi:hypothetical protein|uniref:Uncharacterized protein n=1 Tax=Zea mays TaxID=4577 RepID=A0A804PV50_MAIZE
MVTGWVKAAMGFQRSPKSQVPEAASPSRAPTSGSVSTAGSTPSKASALARSFGAYFPRSSAQVRPAARAPPQVAELLRTIEQLQERESRLHVELLEQKILKEIVTIVPFLEAELAAKKAELQVAKLRIYPVVARGEPQVAHAPDAGGDDQVRVLVRGDLQRGRAGAPDERHERLEGRGLAAAAATLRREALLDRGDVARAEGEGAHDHVARR